MATIDEVHILCKEIKKDVGEINMQIAAINQRCADRGNSIEGIKKTIYGSDGSGGIVSRSSKNKDRLDAINGANAIRLSWQQKIIAPVISAIIVATIFTLLLIAAIHYEYIK